jgi:hypothetical protein
MAKPNPVATAVPEFVSVKVWSASVPLGTTPNANVAGVPETTALVAIPVALKDAVSVPAPVTKLSVPLRTAPALGWNLTLTNSGRWLKRN